MNALVTGETKRLPYGDHKLSVRAANVAANITGVRWKVLKRDGQWYIESTNQLVLRSSNT